jgi:hypothetical protein
VVSLDSEVVDARAGTPFDVNFTIHSAHDGSMQDSLFPLVKATHTETGEVVTAHGLSTGEGHYVASLTLPTTGTWAWEIQPFTGYPADLNPQFTLLTVSAAGVAPATAAAVPGFAGVPMMLWGVLGLLALVAVVAVVTGRRLPQMRA